MTTHKRNGRMRRRHTSARRPGARNGSRSVRSRKTRRAPRRGGFRLPVVLGGIGAGVVVAALVLVAFLSGATATSPAAGAGGTPIALQVVYTAPTSNDTPSVLPSTVRDELSKLADSHESIAITRIEGDGTIETRTVDMTPRTGDNPSDPPLTVPERSHQKTQAKIAQIENELNSPAAIGGRSLFKGLTRVDFAGTPVILVSSLIDLSSPADFRTLNWSTDPSEVVAIADGAIADIEAPVTFVVVPTGGDQPQLGAEDKSYAKNFWETVLRSANADEVTFVDATANPTAPKRDAPTTPVVEPQPLPDTPITPEPDPEHPADPTTASCTIGGSYFAWASPDLLDRDLTVDNLSGCIKEALASCATFEVHGWASYEGGLTPEGRPTHNDPFNQELSEDRVATIVTLLTTELAVPAEDIVTQKGHGNLDLPVPNDPPSPDNRMVRITYTVPATGCGGAAR